MTRLTPDQSKRLAVWVKSNYAKGADQQWTVIIAAQVATKSLGFPVARHNVTYVLRKIGKRAWTHGRESKRSPRPEPTPHPVDALACALRRVIDLAATEHCTALSRRIDGVVAQVGALEQALPRIVEQAIDNYTSPAKGR